MIRFPFLGYSSPYHYYSPYYRTSYKNQASMYQTSSNQNKVSQLNHMNTKESLPCENENSSLIKETISEYETRKIPSKNNPISFHFEGFSDPNQVILEVLGIKLYLDDIIILGLLFILYQEDVKDEMLFISLILLLLS